VNKAKAARRAAAAGQAWQIYNETTRPGAPGLWTRIRSVPRMLRFTVRGEYKGLGATKIGLLVLGMIYIISPIDAIPDFIPFVGVADDMGVAMWMFAFLVGATGEFLDWELRRPTVVHGRVVG
jgi:uncharacterized membrane protein YkvA (DUF1232 family)